MEVKKCERCGNFYISDRPVCENCIPKDNFEIEKLKNYMENINSISSVEEIAYSTDITVKNLNRFIRKQRFYWKRIY